MKVETSDLCVRALCDLSQEAERLLRILRQQLRAHIAIQDEFLTSLVPIKKLDGIPAIVHKMYWASELAHVGPMAAVAGAIAEIIGRALLEKSDEVIIENGGDIWLALKKQGIIGLYAGRSPFSSKIGIMVHPEQTPMGVCTSSARVGHSLSFGKADAVTIGAKDAALADAVATETCNRIRGEYDLEGAVNFALSIEGVTGALAILDDKIAIKGDIELTNIA